MCGGIESPGDCQTPLVFVAGHDTLRAVVRHRQDVLHGTGLDLLVASGDSGDHRRSGSETSGYLWLQVQPSYAKLQYSPKQEIQWSPPFSFSLQSHICSKSFNALKFKVL